jgi:hypothetical protein
MGDPADDEGIYAALATVHWELDRIGLRQVYQPDPAELAASQPHSQTAPAAAEALPPTMPPAMPATPTLGADRRITPEELATLSNDAGTEVLCIVRRDGKQQLLVLEHPSPDLLHMLSQESRIAEMASGIALQPQSERRSPAAWPKPRTGSSHPDSGQNYRAQSPDR